MTQHPGPEAGDGTLDTPARYAQAVRDALAGHPDAEELLDDLDDHLAEIAAESDVPLEERLGPPAAYAEELAAAYGGRPASRQKRRLRPVGRLRDLHATLMGKDAYRGFLGLLRELRPGWWVLRGYLLAMILAGFADDRVLPGDALGWLLVLAFVAASVWWGRSARGRLALPVTLLANAGAVVALLIGVAIADRPALDERHLADGSGPVMVETVSGLGGDVYNIKPYAKDGTPLTDVYLYDQNGRPLTTDPEAHGYTVDRSCGEPILNRYPLPLVEETEPDSGVARSPSCATAAPAAPASSPAPAPVPSADSGQAPPRTRSPEPSGRPSGPPSGVPSPEPSG
ncbi:hypothetical protein ACGF0J_18020 [Nonomuraea sp. NPDC047897]|uniref:hypothetical protein n=1 Tax=Nonomuraea sp. NPDC047897 TaxID=3364346 RepID=UPI003715D665